MLCLVSNRHLITVFPTSSSGSDGGEGTLRISAPLLLSHRPNLQSGGRDALGCRPAGVFDSMNGKSIVPDGLTGSYA